MGDGAVELRLSLVGLGVNTNATEELTTRLGDAVEEKRSGGSDRGLERGRKVSVNLNIYRG